MRIYFFITIMFWALSGYAQPVKTDSLELRLKETEGNERVEVLLNLVEELQRVQSSKALNYVFEAESILTKNPDVHQQVELFYRKGWVRVYRNEYDSAWSDAQVAERLALSNGIPEATAQAKWLKARILRERGQFANAISELDSAIAISKERDDLALQSQLYNEIGSIHRRQGRNQLALDSHRHALILMEEIGDKSGLATTFGFLGIINDVMGNYSEALRFHLESLEVREELSDRRGVAAGLTNIGILHQRLEEYDAAMRYYQRALKVWEELDLEDERATTINNMGAVQELLGNNHQALEYYRKAYDIWNKLGNPYDISIALGNMGAVQMYLGAYDEALGLMIKTLNLRESLGDQSGSANSLTSISLLYEKLGQPDSALVAAKRGLELARATGGWNLIRNAHERLSELYESLANFEQALFHYKEYKAADDSLFNAESQSTIAELQEQYRTKEQQQEIELLQRERELQNLWLGITVAGFILAVVVIALLYNRYKLKHRAHTALEQLHLTEIEKARLRTEAAESASKLLQAENERKSQELEAARVLQLSMLPKRIPENDNVRISAHMETAAEVGGDYYDFDLAEDGSLTFCIGDATGHGTRAGTLVTATKSLFNLMAHEKDLSEILQSGSKAIKKMGLPMLYMALALGRLRNNTMELVGAGMPPALIYRFATRTVETIPLKGMPLGSVVDYPYNLKKVTLQKGDVVLFTSDGFPELINQSGNMLGYSRLPELLKNVGDQDPEMIINYFRNAASNWMGETEANDDITFIVMKMKAQITADIKRRKSAAIS